MYANVVSNKLYQIQKILVGSRLIRAVFVVLEIELKLANKKQ